MKTFLTFISDLFASERADYNALTQKVTEFVAKRFNESDSKQALLDAKIEHVLANQALLAAYLGMTPGGATAEDLDALGARIEAVKEAITNFSSQTTGS